MYRRFLRFLLGAPPTRKGGAQLGGTGSASFPDRIWQGPWTGTGQFAKQGEGQRAGKKDGSRYREEKTGRANRCQADGLTE
jgi:hypothetical protein